MKKHIIFFEAVGGNDKGRDGDRKDTMPVMDYLKKIRVECRGHFFY